MAKNQLFVQMLYHPMSIDLRQIKTVKLFHSNFVSTPAPNENFKVAFWISPQLALFKNWMGYFRLENQNKSKRFFSLRNCRVLSEFNPLVIHIELNVTNKRKILRVSIAMYASERPQADEWKKKQDKSVCFALNKQKWNTILWCEEKENNNNNKLLRKYQFTSVLVNGNGE